MKHLKNGIAILVPFALVAQVMWWLYNITNEIILWILPASWGYEWWYIFAFIIGTIVGVYLLGAFFNLLKPAKWLKHKVEKHIINRLPIVNKVYNFGKDISDSFISDIKNDGDLKVVEVMFAGQKSLGALTDPDHHIIFVPTAPNPLNGFIIQTEEYTVKNMKFIELVQALASLGRINGSKWT